jgi:hypothetical protein
MLAATPTIGYLSSRRDMGHSRAQRTSRSAATILFLACALAGCGASSAPPASSSLSSVPGSDDPEASNPPAATGAPAGERVRGGSPVSFRFPSATGGSDFTAQSVLGRTTVVALLATYDAASQAQARFLTTLHRAHRPRLNVGAIVVEPPVNLPLVAAFRDILALDYPLGFADPEKFLGTIPFGNTRAVPSVFILDAEGRLVWRHAGLAQVAEIEAALAEP